MIVDFPKKSQTKFSYVLLCNLERHRRSGSTLPHAASNIKVSSSGSEHELLVNVGDGSTGKSGWSGGCSQNLQVVVGCCGQLVRDKRSRITWRMFCSGMSRTVPTIGTEKFKLVEKFTEASDACILNASNDALAFSVCSIRTVLS